MTISAHRFWIYLAKSTMALSLFVTVLTVNLYLLLSPAYINWQYDQLKLGSSASLSKSDAQAIVGYLKNVTEKPPLLTTKERIHLADVRKLFNSTFDLFKLAFIVLVVSVVALGRLSTWHQAWRRLALSSIGGIFLLIVFLLITQINFSWLFDNFHQLFFSGDSWLFDRDSVLIKLFPFQFWVRSALIWFLLTLSELAILASIIGVAIRQKS